jgi:type IV secretion system protein VirB11
MVLRKHPSHAYTLAQFVTDGILTPQQKDTIEGLMDTRQTIVIAGAMGSGKTSLLNACLGYIIATKERIVVCEGPQEVICDAEEVEYFRTVEDQKIELQALCRDLFKNSPDTIVIGECTGGEVVPALKAMNVGHRGLMTVHAKTAVATMHRLEQLILEVSKTPQQALIAEAVNVIIHMEHYGKLFRCTDILALDGWSKKTGYQTRSLLGDD